MSDDDEGFITDPAEIELTLIAAGWWVSNGHAYSPETDCDDCKRVYRLSDLWGVSRDGTTIRTIPNRSEKESRREAFEAKWGKPKLATAAQVAHELRLHGSAEDGLLREQIHPHDVLGYFYPSAGAALASAEANRVHHGNEFIGPFEHDDGWWFGLIDLRPQLLDRFGQEPTNPSLPDDWEPSKKERAE